MPGIFRVGKVHNTIIATGHYSKGFKEFLLRHFESVNIDFCYDDIPELKREQSLDGVKTVCIPSKDRLF